MKINVRPLVSAAAATVVSIAAIVALPGASQAQPRAACPSGELQASSLPKRIVAGACAVPGRTIRGAKVAAVIPRPGHGVTANVLSLEGEETLAIDTALDGTVTVATTTEPVGTHAAVQDALPACADDANTLLNYDYFSGGNFYWYYAPAGVQRSGLSDPDAEAALINGTRHITVGNNDCGFGGQPNVNHTYGGQVGVGPNINAPENKCTAEDAWSITGWGNATSDVLASTCTWSVFREEPFPHRVVTTSDMVANYNFVWWNGSGSCPNNGDAYDLEGVTTHERGHTFGLGHPSEGHENLTMAPRAFRCDTRMRTLGLGDFNGLITLYGYR
ncbi:hypothetical protein [Actinoplanes sp. NBRC 103695]|uniref:hypothetical protein n=1 Tax=Actinoplanes sp. NBRC 103695 TaxID=3032202 RepID=UPI0024A48CD4|nr:hypothetical protein [Actinoplanes sp. NBRC 103695]GLY97316.1 hypothetical protein Acsp02_45700 [Actinoplanes sp. NBRC 103695]